MKTYRALFVFVILGFFGNASQAMTRLTPNSYLLSGGLGLTASPGLFLLSPQVEYVRSNKVLLGGLAQAGFGSTSVLFTASGTVRYRFGNHPEITPSVEGGLGLAAGTGGIGFHIMMGIGADYQLDRTLSVGTMIRANFAPPLTTFFLSWPLITARLEI